MRHCDNHLLLISYFFVVALPKHFSHDSTMLARFFFRYMRTRFMSLLSTRVMDVLVLAVL